jgi:hypothetical protein
LTKANNAREETVASEYRNFVKTILNKELPSSLAIHFIHWDMKEKKRDKSKRYEIDMLQHAKKMIGEIGVFSALPLKFVKNNSEQLNGDQLTGIKSFVDI